MPRAPSSLPARATAPTRLPSAGVGVFRRLAQRRSFQRPWIRGAWLGAALSLLCGACGTDAVGVGACREVELARCEAAAQCGMIDDVGACRSYYRDHCLHGVATESAPKESQLRACVQTIESAGRCADREGPKTDPSDCGSDRLSDVEAPNVCSIVEEPERAPACEFLLPDPEQDDEDEDDDTPSPKPKPDAGSGDAG